MSMGEIISKDMAEQMAKEAQAKVNPFPVMPNKEQRIRSIVGSIAMQLRGEELYLLATGKMQFEMKIFIKGLKKVIKD